MPRPSEKAAVGANVTIYVDGEYKTLTSKQYDVFNAVSKNNISWIKKNAEDSIESDTGDHYYYVNGEYVKESNGKLSKSSMSAYQNASSKINKEDNPATAVANEADSKQPVVITGSDYVVNGMNIFTNMMNSLEHKFTYRPMCTYYMRFLVGGHVLVDTTSPDWLENCFLDFNHKMNGSGQANTFTLKVVFKQNDRNLIAINKFESILLSGITVLNENGVIKDFRDLFGNCTFQYGYADCDIKSSVYTGMVTDYDSYIDRGNLVYTLQGYSGIYASKELRLSSTTEYTKNVDKEHPLQLIQNIVDIELKNLYNLEITEEVTKTQPHCADDSFMSINQKNIFAVIQDILSCCIANSDDKTTEYDRQTGPGPETNEQKAKRFGLKVGPTEKQLYTFYIRDIPTNVDGEEYACGTIVICAIPKANSDEDAVYASSITFNYFGPQDGSINHLVRDWNPKYKGSVLMALATSWKKQEGKKYLTMDASGNLVPVKSLGGARPGLLSDDFSSELSEKLLTSSQEYTNWSRVTQYPYEADLTMVGIPCEVPITGVITVNALMMTSDEKFKHHSSGDYMILGKTDNINSSGFFTSFNLFKVNTDFNYDFLDDGSVLDLENPAVKVLGDQANSEGLKVVQNENWYRINVAGEIAKSNRDN